MSAIQPCGPESSSVTPFQTMAAERLSSPGTTAPAGPAGTTTSASTQSVAVQSSFMQVSQVHQEVSAFLGTLGGNLQDNEMLRMLIALLVLNALLNQESGSSNSKLAGAAALELLGGGSGRQEVMFYQSSYSAVQMDYQQSSYVQSAESIQPSASPSQDAQAPRLDTCA